MGFIDDIAKYVAKYAPSYGICVYSPIIAQAILESTSGTSELAKNCNNFFGLKYRGNRCKTALPTPYEKIGSEQKSDGSYVVTVMYWYQFANMDKGVNGYFDFINIANYANLKGIIDPRTYLETIKADKYATSLKYVDNLMAVINKYNLTKYDPIKPPAPIPPSPTPTSKYIFNGVDYTPVFNPNYYALRYEDLKAVFGNNSTLLFNHFTTFGMNEARSAAEVFDPIAYRKRYKDLDNAFGNNWPAYYLHYIQFGIKEGRNGKVQ